MSLLKNLSWGIGLALWCAAGAFPARAADESGDSTVQGQEPVRRVEAVFVLDTTGSMTELIEGAKKKIWSIANSIIDQNPGAEIRMGLVAYRDIGDDYVTRHYPLTTDIQGLYAHLLSFKADGGGDTPESVNEALDVAVTKLGWSDKNQVKADRILFLVGDAPPHMDYKQDRKYPEVIKDAVKKGIIVNTVQAGNSSETRKFWTKMATLGNGDYLTIPQDGGAVVVIATPYDVEINTIQIRLNSTVIPYGSASQQKEVSSKTSMSSAKVMAAPAPASIDMSKYLNKSSKGKGVITGDGDLLADIENGKVTLSTLSDKELPEALRTLSVEDRQHYIDQKREERARDAQKLAELIGQRDAHLKKAKAESASDSSFDKAVEKTLMKQIK